MVEVALVEEDHPVVEEEDHLAEEEDKSIIL
jgi:hypothetical protein